MPIPTHPIVIQEFVQEICSIAQTQAADAFIGARTHKFLYRLIKTTNAWTTMATTTLQSETYTS
jgi:hypothetical protein